MTKRKRADVTLVTTGRIISDIGATAAFNVIQIEHAEAIVAGAQRVNLPVVLQISENAASIWGRRVTPQPRRSPG